MVDPSARRGEVVPLGGLVGEWLPGEVQARFPGLEATTPALAPERMPPRSVQGSDQRRRTG